MQVRELELKNFRCITQADLTPSPILNVLFGDNGSGKTSVLEALHLIGTGRSFRMREPDQAIRDGESNFLIRATAIEPPERTVKIAFQRERGLSRVRVDGENLQAATQLTRTLPVGLVGPDTHAEMQVSTKARRRWLDWTLFHVKLSLWKQYMHAVKQRNVLLRTNAGNMALDAWDKEVVALGNQLHEIRVQIFETLRQESLILLKEIFGAEAAALAYRPGWSAAEDFSEALAAGRERDRAHGVTRVGPHRADVVLSIADKPISTRLSRGQLKLWVGALMLAQALVIGRETAISPVLLVDDFVSDLDPAARRKFLEKLASAGCQLFVTTTEASNIPIPDDVPSVWFHVKHGAVAQLDRQI